VSTFFQDEAINFDDYIFFSNKIKNMRRWALFFFKNGQKSVPKERFMN